MAYRRQVGSSCSGPRHLSAMETRVTFLLLVQACSLVFDRVMLHSRSDHDKDPVLVLLRGLIEQRLDRHTPSEATVSSPRPLVC